MGSKQEERFLIREREIMQTRVARSFASTKPAKKLSPAERLKLRTQINRQLPEK